MDLFIVIMVSVMIGIAIGSFGGYAAGRAAGSYRQHADRLAALNGGPRYTRGVGRPE